MKYNEIFKVKFTNGVVERLILAEKASVYGIVSLEDHKTEIGTKTGKYEVTTIDYRRETVKRKVYANYDTARRWLEASI
jgi:uncharacterized alkaline shock family protein YloU